ncbi:exodeoxyribonuclease V subunit beta [Rhodocyclus purpureus]|uniref:exodeoxyribonuclease V subunit beta n=1 Tax=Rhodocyclus purpureus TaxID=1067 RepID=UPI00191127F6|nr:exodeoxyribonuclease V subunit beta [Rhodocyclus purpureus]MBK5914483.1 exodeoxyribonuclease V subunit beta [Rhodocyclus purpureus]
MTPTQLEALRFPLHGSRLIEASAGTGKTYTIAALYLRLVLGHGEVDEHGNSAAFHRPLTPPEILVVTFTDAATKELRNRIRERLDQAARWFLADDMDEGADVDANADHFLRELRAGYPAEAWSAQARKLQLAAEWMDEAAVSTIHSWCNRMLREHAFDSDSLFTQRLETDQEDLLAEVARDYWRTFMYPLAEDSAQVVKGWWASPDELLDAVRQLLPHAELLAASAEPAAALAAAQQEKLRVLGELKAPWAKWRKELQELLDDARDGKRFNGTKLKKNNYDDWLAKLEAWRDDPQQVRPDLSDRAWERLTPAGLAEVWKDGPPPDHPALEAIAALPAQLAVLPDARGDILRHGGRWISARFADEQARRAQMGFNDLLTRLDGALSGANGARLAEVIRTQFPVALIDEFQDTDAVQYRIFDAVYRVEANDERTAIVLIGDPKQAIYAFRGADIYTYLAARAATAGRLYTLLCNYRSTTAMVAASNRCFEFAESRAAGEGAFLFRRDGENPIPFFAATANGRKDVLAAAGEKLPALSVWRLPPADDGEAMAKGAYLEQMAEICASEMVRLLNLGRDGEAGFFADGELRPERSLRPADLAVLVNNRNEADAIRAALSRRRVRSVYLSDKDSVFRRPEAFDLQLWLTACADPDDGGALRAALATRTLGLDWAALDRFNHDEITWDDTVLQFRGYRDCWRRQGVLPMLRRLLNDFRVPARLLAQGGEGERSLTDVLHLAELLQQASALLDGEHALIRHLAEQRSEEDGRADVHQIRLESDADLVQVITIHKSKGLEYPLVFLPFACAFRATKADDLPLKWHDEDGALRLALADEGDILERVDRERLGEDLRKLYVALTRARYATWIGVAPVKELERSAFGYLIGGDLQQGVDDLAAGRPELAVIDSPTASDETYRGDGLIVHEGPARMPVRSLRENWWIASYSALGSAAAADTPDEDVFREAEAAERSTRLEVAPLPAAVAATTTPSRGLLHDFPRGAAVGTFLHDLLEWSATEGFARVAESRAPVRDAIARRCAVRGWERWIDPLTDWLQDFLRQPLQAAGGESFALAGLDTFVAEMEFWVAVHEVDLRELDALVVRQTLGAAGRPQLLPGQLNGMLKGFIDLIVEHEGRYYVIDYKSNRLGADDAAYTAEAMAQEVLAHRYELQYVLYLLALHRLLKLRLPDYDYDRHVGGALYLFLRGSQSPGRGVHAERPPRELIEALDRLFTAQTAREAA